MVLGLIFKVRSCCYKWYYIVNIILYNFRYLNCKLTKHAKQLHDTILTNCKTAIITIYLLYGFLLLFLLKSSARGAVVIIILLGEGRSYVSRLSIDFLIYFYHYYYILLNSLLNICNQIKKIKFSIQNKEHLKSYGFLPLILRFWK